MDQRFKSARCSHIHILPIRININSRSQAMNNEKAGLGELMKKAQEMQKKMQEIQKQVSEMEVTGVSGGGLVKIVMTGQHMAKRVTLDPSLMKEEKTIVEDLIAAAINDAASKIEK